MIDYRGRYQAALKLLKSITGLQSHPKWLEVQEFIKDCEHQEWTDESPQNNWRSECKGCGLKSAGSCQG